MLGFIKRNMEFVILFLLTAGISTFLAINSSFVITAYNEFSLNQQILGFSGTLFGLLLTAYAIMFGLIPIINKELAETRALEMVNKSFLISIMFSIIIIVQSFVIYFIQDNVKIFLIHIQLGLLTSLILMSFLLVIYLYLLFKIQKTK